MKEPSSNKRHANYNSLNHSFLIPRKMDCRLKVTLNLINLFIFLMIALAVYMYPGLLQSLCMRTKSLGWQISWLQRQLIEVFFQTYFSQCLTFLGNCLSICEAILWLNWQSSTCKRIFRFRRKN